MLGLVGSSILGPLTTLFDHPLTLFIAQAAIIVLLARTLGLVARRLGQPMVIAEIAAGILLGPSLFGWLWPNASALLFPSDSLRVLGMVSQLGLILFMFLIGLELDSKHLRGRASLSVAVSHTSIVLPFALGGVLALELYPKLAPDGVRFVPFVLFMGAAMSISAFPVLARILVERRLVRSRVGSFAIACAAVDDVTAWCILAFVVSSVRSASVDDAIRTSALAIVYIASMLWLVRPILQRVGARSRPVSSHNLLALILVGLLGSSFLTELIGVHALFGAFMFGAILPKQGSFASALVEKLEDIAVVLLVPLFFAYSGLRTEIGLLDSAESWLICALITLVACVGKLGGAVLAARLTKLPWREAIAIGVLLNTRGMMALIVLNIGLDLGVISPLLFTMMVITALVTTLMTTPLLEIVYPLSELVRQLAEPPEAPAESREPSGFSTVLYVEQQEQAKSLMTVAAAIAGSKQSRARIYAVTLDPPEERASFVLTDRASSAREQELLPPEVLDRARELDLDVRPLSFVSTAPARDICDVADVKDAGLVLLSWQKPMLGQTMLSGTVHEVMEEARSDVAVLVDRGLDRIRRILVPYLGSDHDRASLALARRIGENVGAAVCVLHVVPPATNGSAKARQRLQQELSPSGEPRGNEIELQVVVHADPAEAVIEESGRGYDLVLIGVGKKWGLEHRSFGFQPEAVLKRSAASVLVVRRAARAEPSTVTEPAALTVAEGTSSK